MAFDSKAKRNEYLRRWNAENPAKAAGYSRKYRQAHRVEMAEKNRLWHAANKGKVNARKRRYRAANPERAAEWSRRKGLLLRQQALQAYGGPRPACVCCGIAYMPFLALDHVNNDGTEHRKVAGSGRAFYQWLRVRGFPKNPPLQIMCHNCNHGKRLRDGCPHDRPVSTGTVTTAQRRL